MKAIKSLSAILLITLMCIGCAATFEQNTYRTLAVAGITYDTGMKTISNLQAQGKITPAQRSEINKDAGYFYVAYQSAVAAFVSYKKGVVNQSFVITAIDMFQGVWKTFAANTNRIIPNTLPAVIPEEVK